ncbi:MAG: hypothetical protein ACK5GZ_17500 [Cyanobium sp.]
MLIGKYCQRTGTRTASGSQAAAFSSLEIIPMSALSLLADHEAETINGGFFNSFNLNSYSWKAASTSLGQSNNATNVGVGLLLGIGSASSSQTNIASIGTVIG